MASMAHIFPSFLWQHLLRGWHAFQNEWLNLKTSAFFDCWCIAISTFLVEPLDEIQWISSYTCHFRSFKAVAKALPTLWIRRLINNSPFLHDPSTWPNVSISNTSPNRWKMAYSIGSIISRYLRTLIDIKNLISSVNIDTVSHLFHFGYFWRNILQI